MNSCQEYREILLLDIYGELDPVSRSKSQAHLKGCTLCRIEHARMLSLVGKVKETMTPPPLSDAESRLITRAVRAEMVRAGEGKSKAGWLSRRWRVTPALATACVFAAMISIWSLGTFDSFLNKERTAGKAVKDFSQNIRPEDMEIIKNLDLLEQMDSVEKLVRTLDEPEDNPSKPEPDSKTRGMTSHDKRVHRA